MEILKEITPAEAYFLFERFSYDEKLMKLTLGKLLFDKTFEIIYVKKKLNKNDKRESTYKMIRIADLENKKDYTPAEKAFLEYFPDKQKQYQCLNELSL